MLRNARKLREGGEEVEGRKNGAGEVGKESRETEEEDEEREEGRKERGGVRDGLEVARDQADDHVR
eukprot:1526747-Rhodomonas_salina.2